ncbi:MAG: hypothetical protein KDC34_05085 [Saprospiraceae bacterium]|nr:hypothetical protein [Saprospiraceae bacterium]
MKKYTLLSFLFVFLLLACAENEKPEQTETVPESGLQTGEEILNELREAALDEGDTVGRIMSSIKPIQEEFARSEPQMPELVDVEVSIDGNCNLKIVNHATGNIETRVNLKQLDSNGFSLIPDNDPGEFPGLQVSTIDQASVVEIYRNGELITRNNELVIKLVDRAAIERITPVLLQMMMICNGTI